MSKLIIPQSSDSKVNITQSTPADVPSVTKLLNRKKLEVSNTSHSGLFTQPSVLEQASVGPSTPLGTLPYPGTSSGLQIALLDPKTPPSDGVVRVKTAHFRSKGQMVIVLQDWSVASLKSGNDPIAGALLKLIERGALASLFLSAQRSSTNRGVAFTASAALGAAAHKDLWTGISWSPVSSPETWGKLVKQGFIEIPPLASIESPQKIFPRGAFGLENGDWLTIVRCGSVQACRGLLAITSKRSLASELAPLLGDFGATVTPSPALQAA